MKHQSPKRPRVAMLSNEDALRVLRSKWPEAMTAREVYFAARPPVSDQDRSVSGSAYAKKALDALVEQEVVVLVKDDSSRSSSFRVRHMPSASIGLEGIEAREVLHDRDVPRSPLPEAHPEADAGKSEVHGTDNLDEVFSAMARIIQEVQQPEGSADAPAPASTLSRNDPDPIATILLGMARAPRVGSRIDIVKNQAAEGIAWARAAGWTDHRIAQEIVEASRLDARPEEILHLVAAVPGRGPSSVRTAQAR